MSQSPKQAHFALMAASEVPQKKGEKEEEEAKKKDGDKKKEKDVPDRLTKYVPPRSRL